jgi:alpha-tubulin suppressor-like RCC1 family protein
MGGLRCWGHNGGGELGNGTLLDVPAPPLTDVLTGARAVAAGANFTCALLQTGGLRCWGYNSDGQLGDDTPNATEKVAPGATDVLNDVVAVAVGDAHACAQTKAGGVRCWGANASGQLGDGLTPEPAPTPPPVDVVRFTGTCR